jgi:hypothetical protein
MKIADLEKLLEPFSNESFKIKVFAVTEERKYYTMVNEDTDVQHSVNISINNISCFREKCVNKSLVMDLETETKLVKYLYELVIGSGLSYAYNLSENIIKN